MCRLHRIDVIAIGVPCVTSRLSMRKIEADRIAMIGAAPNHMMPVSAIRYGRPDDG
jgi:hypothetical protein